MLIYFLFPQEGAGIDVLALWVSYRVSVGASASVGTDTDVGIHVDVEVGLGINDGLDMRHRRRSSCHWPTSSLSRLQARAGWGQR